MAQQAAVDAMPPDNGETFAAAHRELLSDRSIQFDMAPFVMPKPPAWLKWLAEFIGSPAAGTIFWVFAGLGAVIILILLVMQISGLKWPWTRKAAKPEAAEDAWRPEAAPARALLREADALAADGRFDEAAHLLLFRSIEDIDSRRPKLIRPALTSRDIAGAGEIPADPRSAFAGIVMMVERSLFGGRTLVEQDWRECRAAYERFAFAEAWR